MTSAPHDQLTVCRLPDPILFTPAANVAACGEVLELAERMVALMRASPACVGVAAPQVGAGVRLMVMDVSGHKKAPVSHGLVVLVNPTVVEHRGRAVAREGCLSVPDLTGDVPRWTQVVVSGVDPRTGGSVVVAAEDFEARVLQHELDHLDGLLFLDRVRRPGDLYGRRRYK